MPLRIYRMVADEARVDDAGTPPRPESARVGHEAIWNIPESELHDVPVLRNWLHANGVADIEEYGESGDDEPLSDHGEPYRVGPAAWTSWQGPELIRKNPCPSCGLSISTVAPPTEIAADLVDNVLDKLAETPMCLLPAPRCLVIRSDIVETLRSVNLDAGLVTHSLDSRGQALLAWSDVPLGGPAYPHGPAPCTTCGRALRDANGKQILAMPRYSYKLTFKAQPDHWSWTTIYGQQTPLVSHAVAEFLLDAIPTVTFGSHGRPEDPDAFLPQQYRQ